MKKNNSFKINLYFKLFITKLIILFKNKNI